jgi:hypothetical protein
LIWALEYSNTDRTDADLNSSFSGSSFIIEAFHRQAVSFPGGLVSTPSTNEIQYIYQRSRVPGVSLLCQHDTSRSFGFRTERCYWSHNHSTCRRGLCKSECHDASVCPCLNSSHISLFLYPAVETTSSCIVRVQPIDLGGTHRMSRCSAAVMMLRCISGRIEQPSTWMEGILYLDYGALILPRMSASLAPLRRSQAPGALSSGAGR